MAKTKLTTGLDLGEFALKCAVVESNSGAVQSVWHAELFPERGSSNQVFEPEVVKQRLFELIEKCEKECPGFTRELVTSVPGEFFRYIELPQLSSKELEVAVPFEAQKHIPFPLDEVTLNYVAVPQISDEKKKSAVFFVAAHKKRIQELSALLEACGLNVKRVGTPSLALSREFFRNHAQFSNEFAALLHVGFGSTRVAVIRSGCPYYVRKIPLGGRDLTYGFQMSRQSGWPEAEKYKLAYDIGQHEVGFEPFINQLTGEIKKSLLFFAKEFKMKEGRIEKAFLSGGAGLQKGLAAHLSQALGISVVVDGWGELTFRDIKEEAALYKVAVGLALEG